MLVCTFRTRIRKKVGGARMVTMRERTELFDGRGKGPNWVAALSRMENEKERH